MCFSGKAILSVFLPLALSSVAQARPEYALIRKVNCTQCHVLPSGGGPRLLEGKIYGSHGHKPSKTAFVDKYAGDFRAEAYYPTHRTSQQGNGLLLMVAAASADVPVHEDAAGWGLRALLTADFGVLSSGTREAALIWSSPRGSSAWVPSRVTFGRIYLPFGLLTDEHRSYVQMQTVTSIRDYEMGGYASWDFAGNLHLDLALTNGFHSAGAPTASDITYAVTPNVRWNSPGLPLFVGGSATYHHTHDNPPSPYAAALYGGLSFGAMTSDRFKLILETQVSLARYWNRLDRNPRLDFFFSGGEDPAGILTSSRAAQSLGVLGEALYPVTQTFWLEYKFDRLQFDRRFPGDAYERNGFGFRWFFDSNVQLLARYEFAGVGRESEKQLLSQAAQDDFFLMLRLWL